MPVTLSLVALLALMVSKTPLASVGSDTSTRIASPSEFSIMEQLSN